MLYTAAVVTSFILQNNTILTKLFVVLHKLFSWRRNLHRIQLNSLLISTRIFAQPAFVQIQMDIYYLIFSAVISINKIDNATNYKGIECISAKSQTNEAMDNEQAADKDVLMESANLSRRY